MEKYDATVVFANSINEDGTLREDVKLRVNRGVEEYHARLTSRLLMSGSNDWPLQNIPCSQAEAMKRYAVEEKRVPGDAVILENYSKETKASMLFSKVGILIPNGLRNIKVITSDYHLPRAIGLAQFMLPPDEFSVDFEGVATSDPTFRTHKFLKAERAKVNRFPDVMEKRGINPYDDRALANWLLTEFDAYIGDDKLKNWLSQYVSID